MKKFTLLIFLFSLLLVKANAQSLDMFNVEEAFTAYKTIPNIDKYEIVLVEAIEMQGSGLLVDFETGRANNWVFATRSKDTSDHELHMFIFMSVLGTVNYQEQTDSENDAQQSIPLLNTTWFGSSQLAVKFKNTPDLNQYIQVKGNNITAKFLILSHFYGDLPNGKTEANVWSISALVSETDMATCTYDAETGDNLGCVIDPPLSVNEVAQIALELFPNPTTNKLKVKEIPEGATKYEIYNHLGAIVGEGVIANEIDVSTLPAGTYFLKIGNTQKKFVKI
ncbi:MAG: T9SS type A sorting domain-containing protein [Candidatus Kapaibacteriota bacterium]